VIHYSPTSENGILRSSMEDRVNRTNRELKIKLYTFGSQPVESKRKNASVSVADTDALPRYAGQPMHAGPCRHEGKKLLGQTHQKNGCPRAGSEAPARGQLSPLSTLGG
jgi:hypothetical protein